MELTKIDNAFKIYTRIKELDAEIIEIDKIAMQLANDDTDVSFSLDIKNFTIKPKCNIVSVDDVYKSVLENYTFSFFSYGDKKKEEPKDHEVTTFKTSIATQTSLKILGLLLSDKMDRRNILINKLQKCGVKI